MRTTTTRALAGIVGLGVIDSSSSSSSSKASAPKPVAAIDSLKGNDTQIKLDQGFVDALTTLKLTPKVLGTAKLTDGSLIFPITGGNVKYYKPGSVNPFVQGDIKHDGSGISLTAGNTKVELTNFDIDPGASKLYGDVAVNGTQAVSHAYLFYLDGTTLKALQKSGDTAILEGTKVEISDVAAPLLDKTFNTDAVKAGLLVGIAKITVNTK
jgi:hypothetical protein